MMFFMSSRRLRKIAVYILLGTHIGVAYKSDGGREKTTMNELEKIALR
jgi:hypothetical protein